MIKATGRMLYQIELSWLNIQILELQGIIGNWMGSEMTLLGVV